MIYRIERTISLKYQKKHQKILRTIQMQTAQPQTLFDTKRNGLYHDRVKDFLIDRLIRSESMAESHYHPYYEFFYVVKGSCRIFVEHSLHFVNEGDLIIIPPSSLHRTQYETEVERATISFSPIYIEEINSILGKNFLEDNLKSGKMIFQTEKRLELEKIFNELIREDKKNDSFSEISRKSLLLKLLVLIARNSHNRSHQEAVGETEISIQKAARFVFEHFASDITLQMAAEVAGMRDTYFSRKFQEVTGYGFKEYLTNLRIQHSQEMLLSSRLTITQIALACGFSNSNYFGDAFKKHTGMSPRDFRKQK